MTDSIPDRPRPTRGDGARANGAGTNGPRGGQDAENLRSAVDRRQARKLDARRKGPPRPWFGLGLFGLIGWSVAVPTLLGIALGIWIDRHHASRHSWTLMLLFAGLAAGCLQAWYWVKREGRVD